MLDGRDRRRTCFFWPNCMSSRDEAQQLQLAFSLHRSGKFADAAKVYRKIIKRNPRQPHALHSLGIIEAANGNQGEAAQLMARSLSVQPTNLDFTQNYASVLCQLGRFEAACEVCRKGLEIDGNRVYLLYVLAAALFKLGRQQESLAAFDGLLLIEPNHVAAIIERSSVMLEAGQFDAARADIERALSLAPGYAEAHVNQGILWAQLKRYDDAIASFNRALALDHNATNAWLALGQVLFELKRYHEAGSAFDKALSLRPDQAKAWLGKAAVLLAVNRPGEALGAYDRVLALDPNMAVAWRGRGYAFTNLGRHEDAAQAYEQAQLLEPGLPGLSGSRLQAKLQCCDWGEFDSDCSRLIQAVEDDKEPVLPFDCLAVPTSLDVQLKCSRSWVAHNLPTGGEPVWRGERYAHDKIRIGYVSADFRQHPVTYLAAGLFERHDRSRFEILGVSIGPNDRSEIRARIERSFDRFIDCAALTDNQIAERVRAEEIDILVDLNGFTQHARTEIFRRRPAPVQVNYLGFPGTMGAQFMDYIVADPVMIPSSQQYGYVEKVAYLPHSYMPHDGASRLASEGAFARAELGLPERGFVFCCFNAAYKFNPDLFRSWMRVLAAVEGSVLWLSQANATALRNLRKEAAAAGIDPDRLVFAQRLPSSADHLARLRLADLFLDSWPYNAHTTASDALWMGLPVLTRIGATFAGRVAASLLSAAGSPELITESRLQFESLAIDLATEPSRLAAIKDRLARNRSSTALFDTSLYARQLENLYAQMYHRLQGGMSPDHIYVDA